MKEEHSESAYDEALSAIRSGDNKSVSSLYDRYRGEFIAFVCRDFLLDKNDAVELYQESFIALYENVSNGKLTKLTASLKTYLFRIARNKMMNRMRDSKPHVPLTDEFVENEDDWTPQHQITYEIVQQMQEPCNTVLTLFLLGQMQYGRDCPSDELFGCAGCSKPEVYLHEETEVGTL